MAIEINISDLLSGHVIESTRMEFKASFNPDPIVHTICAFANDIDNIGGGYILVGVEEKDGCALRPVTGIPKEKVDSIQKEMIGYCNLIEPHYHPVSEPVEVDGRMILVIYVPGGYGRPYKAAKSVYGGRTEKAEKHYYIRKFSSTVIASPEEERELFQVSSSIPFDDQANLEARVSDLDLGLMRSHLKEIGSSLYERSLKMDVPELAEHLKLVSGPRERMRPLNVGILMFSELIDRYFREAKIEVVDIPDPRGVNITEKVFTGPIQRQLRDALAYLKNYALKEVTRKETGKAEAKRIANYPYDAVEEVLSNAVYHRSYQIQQPITVRITPEAMEITSFPGFDRSITDQNIADYKIRARYYRNRRIGDFLKELGLIEGRNTGFPNAFDALKANGSGMPVFEMDPERSFLSVTIPVHPCFLPQRRNEKRDAYMEQIVSRLREGPLSLTELSAAMGYKGITKKLSQAVDELITEERVVRIVVGRSKIKLALVKE